MQALVKLKKADGYLRLLDVPEPEPMSNEVLVEISFCGVCGTDVKILHDHHAYYRPPLILGHEFSGVVADVGADVTGISVGDAVVVPPSPIRVESLEARARSPWQTGVRDGFEAEWGFTTYGGFTKYGVFGAERIVKLPAGVDVESAALVEPLSVCVHAVLDNASVRATDVVVVSGAGAIGLLTAQLAKAQGATVVVLGLGVDEHRLALAKSLGADAVVNTERDDPEDVTLDLSQGAGADVVFECVGAEASVVNCIRLVRRGGHYVQVGTSASVMSVEFAQIAYKELTVKGNLAATRINWEHAVKLIAMGKIQTKPLVSHKLPFSDWEHGFALAEEKRSVKVLLYPG